MTALVPIAQDQWVLAYVDHYGPHPGDIDLVAALERLQYGGSGWDSLRNPEEQFEVLQVERVMPKTFNSSSGRWSDEKSKRYPRYLVVAAADTAGELLALRDKLFSIGFAADLAIQDETERLVSAFAEKTRAEAVAKVHAALPHIFGRKA